MVGNPYRYRAALRQLDNRHATAAACCWKEGKCVTSYLHVMLQKENTRGHYVSKLNPPIGCLLAVLFLVPFAARVFSISMVILSMATAAYVMLIVPLATGYITLGSLFRIVRKLSLTVLNVRTLQYSLHQIVLFFLWLHELYCSLQNIHTTVIQVLYFVVAEKALCPDQKFISLYGLLFCTMLAYLYQSLQSRHWCQLMFTTTTTDFLRLTSTFIILRLGKGVALSFVLITITLQFDHLEPCASFVTTTGIYFIITQFLKRPCKENVVVTAVQCMNLYIFEGLEEYWIPLLMNCLGMLLTVSNVVIAMYVDSGNIVLCLVVIYTNVIVTLQKLQEECMEPFKEQLKVLHKYPIATKDQMLDRGDTVCPVCLDDMHIFTARITPCHHIFHGQCLRQCILQYQQCPLCKQAL